MVRKIFRSLGFTRLWLCLRSAPHAPPLYALPLHSIIILGLRRPRANPLSLPSAHTHETPLSSSRRHPPRCCHSHLLLPSPRAAIARPSSSRATAACPTSPLPAPPRPPALLSPRRRRSVFSRCVFLVRFLPPSPNTQPRMWRPWWSRLLALATTATYEDANDGGSAAPEAKRRCRP
jgi:hypothetical protein